MTLPAPWLAIAPDSDFSLYNLPFGIFSNGSKPPRVGVAIGEWIIDMATAARFGILHPSKVADSIYQQSTLNPLMAVGHPAIREIRGILQQQLTRPGSSFSRSAEQLLIRQADATMHLPVAIGDYTDFYSSLEHATNVGKLFRPDNPLLPNWKHLPVAYHGRASSIVVSGTPVRRPSGQVLPAGATEPVFAPSEALDYELELGFLIGKKSEIGQPIPADEAEDYIFGCVLFNDWSARDIQRWEYQPLGPFLSKNFASSMSPWVVTMDALDAFRVAGPTQDPEPLRYLQTSGALNFDLNLEVAIKPERAADSVVCVSTDPAESRSVETQTTEIETNVCRTNARHLYWNIRQQLAHHTVSGCNLRVGDLLATGTISGPGNHAEPASGCLLELTEGGRKPIRLADGSERTFLQDGDEVIMRGYAGEDDARVGFGEVRGKILSALI